MQLPTTRTFSPVILAVAALLALLGVARPPVMAPHHQVAVAPTIVRASSECATACLPEWGAVTVLSTLGESCDRNLAARLKPAAARAADTRERVCIIASDRTLLEYSFSLTTRPAHLLQTGVAPPLA